MRKLFKEFTFEEINKQFGWNLNISVSIKNEKEGYRLLNYLTAPTVLIWSAI